MGAVVGIALVWFIIEMLLWYLVAQFISGWWVFFWFIIAAVIGISLIKKAAGTLNPMAQQMKNGVIPNPANQPPESTIAKSVASGIAGLLFLLPGLLTDLGAVLIMLPFVQRKLTAAAKNYALKNQDKMMAMMAKQMGGNGMGGMSGNPFGGNPFGQANPFGGNPFGGGKFGNSTVVDGEAKTVKTDVKRIKSANDE
ncbi:FxsA family protein [Moraxella nasovis]|uniref:FxsA family protein n=1 Tax=Moraxella nasovis TaxID=2904121 RepID=UPI001F606749|nr:FxsA family protein [Moraxella nasovis]UNU73177.1 FxsA family protein [Moraxella nasovis]